MKFLVPGQEVLDPTEGFAPYDLEPINDRCINCEKIKKILESNRNLTNVASGDFISNVVGALFWLYIAVLLTPEEYGLLNIFGTYIS